jgi:hypothetical protein
MIINIIVLKINVAQPFWVQFLVIKNKFTMTKLSIMTSYISFMINGWNVPHVVCNDFRAISHFYPLWMEY